MEVSEGRGGQKALLRVLVNDGARVMKHQPLTQWVDEQVVGVEGVHTQYQMLHVRHNEGPREAPSRCKVETEAPGAVCGSPWPPGGHMQ